MQTCITINEAALLLSTRIFNYSAICGVRFKEEYEKVEKSKLDDSSLWELFHEFLCLFFYYSIRIIRQTVVKERFSIFLKALKELTVEGTIEVVHNNGTRKEKLIKSYFSMLDNAVYYYDLNESKFFKRLSIDTKAFSEIGQRLRIIDSRPNSEAFVSLLCELGRKASINLGIKELIKITK